MNSFVGRTISHYQITREIGRGGMATVYLAKDLKHGREVALKVMREEVAEAVGRDRFLREIELAATLNHPLIVPLYDSGSIDSTLYYVMPWVEGESLKDRLETVRRMGQDEATRIIDDVADALDHAHKRGIVHRDIKPGNILISNGRGLVADFGVAAAISATTATALTLPGSVIGTPAYMSPEQLAGGPIDGRSDLYSLGCVLFEMLAGQPPFRGATLNQSVGRRQEGPESSLHILRPGLPRRLYDVTAQLMSQNPADRYQSGAELIDALRGGRSARRAVHSRQYRRLLVIASVMSVLALAIGAGLRRWTITHQAIAKSTVQVLRVDPPVGTVLSRATLATGVPIRVTIQTQGSDPGEGHEAYLRLMANSSSFLQDAGGPVNGLRSWMIAETRAPFGETQLSLAGTLTVKHIASDGRIHLSLTRWVMGKSPADATFSVEYSLEFEVGR